MRGKLTLIILLIALAPCIADKASIENEITNINTQMQDISSHIINNQASIAKEKLAILNEQLQNDIVSGIFYYDIINTKKNEPGYTPSNINEPPAVLYPEEWQRIFNTLRSEYTTLAQKIQQAKKEIAIAQYKTALSVLMAASYQIYDITTKFTGVGAVESVSTEVGKFAVTEYLNYAYGISPKALFTEHVAGGILIETLGEEIKVVVNNFEQLNKTKEGKTKIINTLNKAKKILVEQYRRLHTARQDINVLEYDVLALEENLDRIKTQINAATSITLTPLTDAFDTTPYKEALGTSLENVKNGETSWDSYFTTKTNINQEVKQKYEEKKQELTDTNQTTEELDKAYGEFLQYYETYDTEDVTKRNKAVNELTLKIEAWTNKTRDLLNAYETINFEDLEIPKINTISVTVPPYDQMNENDRQDTLFLGSQGTSEISNLDSLSTSIPWYESLINYCITLESNANYINLLVNAGRENKPVPERGTEVGFSTLYSTSTDSANAIKNLKEIKTFMNSLADYAITKSSETEEITSLIESARNSLNSISAHVNASGNYLTNDYCATNNIYYSSTKIPKDFGNTIDPCDAGRLYDYIETDIQDLKTNTESMNADCTITAKNVDALLSYEQNKLDFITNLGSSAKELTNKMEKHTQLLNTLKELRDAYNAYYTGLHGSDYATLTYIKDTITELKNQKSNLTEFASIQEDIKEINNQIKPVLDSIGQNYQGTYSVLEEDKEAITNMTRLQYLEEGEITLDEIKNEFAQVSEKLEKPYNEVMINVSRGIKMNEYKNKMSLNRFQLEHYSKYILTGDVWGDETEYQVYTVATNEWQCNVLQEYANNNFFKQDPELKALYETIKTDYLFIVDAFRQVQMLREQQAQALVPGKDYYYGYPEDPEYLIPNDEASDPMLSVIYPYYSKERLTYCNMTQYLNDWDRLHQATSIDEDRTYWLERSKNEGKDYLYSPEDRLNYLVTYGDWCASLLPTDPSCTGRQFWLEESRRDGLDYLHPNPDGTYPPYTETENEFETLEETEQEEIETSSVYEQENDLLPEQENVIKIITTKRNNMTESYTIHALKPAKLFGFIPLTIEVQTIMNANLTEIIQEVQPWWSFLLIFD